jgi:hypothetical protein
MKTMGGEERGRIRGREGGGKGGEGRENDNKILILRATQQAVAL